MSFFYKNEEIPFSHIHSLIVPEQKLTIFAVELPQGRAPPIPSLSQIHPAITEICAFKVCLIFFVVFFLRPGKVDRWFLITHFLNFDASGRTPYNMREATQNHSISRLSVTKRMIKSLLTLFYLCGTGRNIS